MTDGGEHIAMEPMRIAIVPYDTELEGVLAPVLYRVASAMQRQVTEHLEPVWGASAIVSAFPSLDEVPSGYATVAITEQNLPQGSGGFHYPDGGAGALINYDPDKWTMRVSHEVLEMVVDPLGVRYVFGPSLADDEQGLVEYLVEVCDPVEENDYFIDGVRVSDFVYPAFYDARSVKQRYSFAYAANLPFHPVKGGYISWAVERPQGGVFQAFGTDDNGGLTLKKVADVSTSFSRESMDALERSNDPDEPARPALSVGRQSRGDQLRGEIARQLTARDPGSPAASPYAGLIEDLANNTGGLYDRCNNNPRELLDLLNAIGKASGAQLPPGLFDDRTRIAPRSDYQVLNAMYKGGHPISYDFGRSNDARLLAGMYSL